MKFFFTTAFIKFPHEYKGNISTQQFIPSEFYNKPYQQPFHLLEISSNPHFTSWCTESLGTDSPDFSWSVCLHRSSSENSSFMTLNAFLSLSFRYISIQECPDRLHIHSGSSSVIKVQIVESQIWIKTQNNVRKELVYSTIKVQL